ncbi:MAG: LamG-like jellyroll fold domain-containing protein [Verrucomicrobiales bacterium]
MKQIRPALAALFLCAAPLCPADLKVHWQLDETSGAVAADSSGNGIDGAWQGPGADAGWVPGGGVDGGGSVSFSGVKPDSFITSSFSAVSGAPFTISAWVKTAAAGNNGAVYLGDGGFGDRYYVVRVRDGFGWANARNTSEVNATGSTAINDGQWHHLVGVYAGNADRKIYVDGVLEASSTTNVNAVTLNRFGIGALTRNTPYNPADMFTGEMDDVALWDRAFSAADVAAARALILLGAGDAADVDPLMAAFGSQGTAAIAGRTWEYATGLAGALGAFGGSLATGDAFVVLDAAGNGMRVGSEPGDPVVNDFSAAPAQIYLGESATLSWDVADADSVAIDQGIGDVEATAGTRSVSPEVTTTYTLTATNGQGDTVRQATVAVVPDPVIVSFTISQSPSVAGQPVTLSWEAENFTSLAVDGGVGALTEASGSLQVSPGTNTTYTLTATNAQGSATAQVTAEVLAPAFPVLHWALDESAGSAAPDSAGGHDGSLIGGPVWDPAGGAIGGALVCDGTDDVVRYDAAPIAGYPFVMSGWVKTSQISRQIVAHLGNSLANTEYFAIGVNNTTGDAYLTARDGASFQEAAGVLVADGAWHQLVGLFESDGSKKLYVDGSLAATIGGEKPFIATVNRFASGRLDRASPADHLNGSLDDIALWAGGLTADEVAVFYSFGLGGGTAAQFPAFRDAFAAQGITVVGGVPWEYATGLTGVPGESGGSVAGGDAYIVFDSAGNGMRVASQGEPIVLSFAADRAAIAPGVPVTLSWNLFNATSATIGGEPVDPASGTAVVNPNTTTIYTLAATNAMGTSEAAVTVTVAAEAQHPRIAEFLAKNDSGLTDDDGDHSDWIELHNPTGFFIDLAGYALTNDAATPAMWVLPPRVLAPGERIVVFASGKDRADPGAVWHTNFTLDADGDYLALIGAMARQ